MSKGKLKKVWYQKAKEKGGRAVRFSVGQWVEIADDSEYKRLCDRGLFEDKKKKEKKESE